MKFLLVILVLGCLQTCFGPARASTTEDAIEALCPGRGYLAPHVDAACESQSLDPIVLVAQMYRESRCRMDVVGKRGERCALQLGPLARRGFTSAQIVDPVTCIHAGAAWLRAMVDSCGGSLRRGLGAYGSGKCNGGKRYARRVLAVVERIRKAIEAKGAPKS